MQDWLRTFKTRTENRDTAKIGADDKLEKH